MAREEIASQLSIFEQHAPSEGKALLEKEDAERLRQVIEVLRADREEEGFPLLLKLDRRLQRIRLQTRDGHYEALERDKMALERRGGDYEDTLRVTRHEGYDRVGGFCLRLTPDPRLNMRVAELLAALAEGKVQMVDEVPWQIIPLSAEDAPRTAVGVLLHFHEGLKKRGLITEPEPAPAEEEGEEEVSPPEEAPFAVRKGICELLPGKKPLTISVTEGGESTLLVEALEEKDLVPEGLSDEIEVGVWTLGGFWLQATQGDLVLLTYHPDKKVYMWMDNKSVSYLPTASSDEGKTVIRMGKDQHFLITRIKEAKAVARGLEATIEFAAVKLTDNAPPWPGEEVEGEVAPEEEEEESPWADL